MPMTRMTLEERIQVVRLFSIYEKPSHVRRAWRKKFGTEPPTRRSIMSVNKKFNKTGSVADLTRSGRPKTSTSQDNIVLVETAIKRDPTKTLRALSQDLGINKTSVHRIKRESEKNGNLVQTENRKLKDKIYTQAKQIETLENKVESLTSATNANTGGNSKAIILTNNANKDKDLFPQDVQLMDQSDVVTLPSQLGSSAVITLTPVGSSGNSTQILHIPPETYRLLQLQCTGEDTDQISSFSFSGV